MKYDFTTILDRKGKDAIAVDAPDMESCFGADYFSKAKRSGLFLKGKTETGIRPYPHVGGGHEFPHSSHNSRSNHRESEASCLWLFCASE